MGVLFELTTFGDSLGSGSQALALSAQADKQGYYGVKLQGYQDTLLANEGYQIYAKSYIDGATYVTNLAAHCRSYKELTLFSNPATLSLGSVPELGSTRLISGSRELVGLLPMVSSPLICAL